MKKGIGQRTVMSLVVIALFVIIAFVLAGNIISLLGGWLNGAECGFTATLASTKVDSLFCVSAGEFVSPTALNCPRTNIVFQPNSLRVTFKETVEEFESTMSAEYVERVVALELADCWEKFGSGQIALFPEGDKGWKGLFGGEDARVCHICSEFSFAEDAQITGTVNLQKSLDVKVGDKTVREALNNPKAHCQTSYRSADGGCWDDLETHLTEGTKQKLHETKFSPMGAIDTSKNYAVIIMRHGYEFCSGDADEAGYELSMFAYVVPQDELALACDMVVT